MGKCPLSKGTMIFPCAKVFASLFHSFDKRGGTDVRKNDKSGSGVDRNGAGSGLSGGWTEAA